MRGIVAVMNILPQMPVDTVEASVRSDPQHPLPVAENAPHLVIAQRIMAERNVPVVRELFLIPAIFVEPALRPDPDDSPGVGHRHDGFVAQRARVSGNPSGSMKSIGGPIVALKAFVGPRPERP